MTDDEHATTRTLKRVSPFWGWVRANPSLVIGGLSIIVSGAIGWHDLKSRMGAIETKVDEIAHRPAAVTDEEFSALKSEFAQLRSELDRQKGRWEQVDSVPELRGRRSQHK
jgi:hypothetical protein